MAETIPYTYLIGWPEHNRYYYGVRYANGCSPEESKQRISNSNKGKIKPTSQCPHCDKIGGINTMPRWHFDNCKELKHDSRRI